MKDKQAASRRSIPMILALAIALPLALYAVTNTFYRSLSRQELDVIADSVRRAAVQCYALEGVYPPTLDDLQARYGVSTPDGRYWIDYQYVASNLLPDITVLPVS